QVVPDNDGQDNWLNNVIPHEISHLYFYQASHNPLTKAPEWIDEGIAQYNEFRDNSAELLDVATAIYRGNYVPLPSISNQFGHEKIEVRLAYAEALSAITYLIEMYGETGLAQILSAYKQGASDDGAISAVTGGTMEAFETSWLAWVGDTPGVAPTSTPAPTVEITDIIQGGTNEETGNVRNLFSIATGMGSALIILIIFGLFRRRKKQKAQEIDIA
ncbi:MAG: peptidase MA family metallohydrolase, partial [Chloroflexota bacterium]